MQEQNFKNHPRFVPLYHFILFLIIAICLAGSVWNIFRAYNHQSGRLVAAILFGLCVCAIIIAWYARAFALKAQDRGIRAEENLRHFVMTGKLIDKRLSMPQIIALRFADDSEFLAMAEKAANEDLKANDIKRAIKKWRADHHRM